jgi:hypothetical protein
LAVLALARGTHRDDGRMDTNMTDDIRSEMKAGFKKVDDQFKKVDDRFKKVDDQFADLQAEIRSEGETTRRHFDIVAEQFKEYVKVLADGTARNTERLDDHDRRLTALEAPRGS